MNRSGDGGSGFADGNGHRQALLDNIPCLVWIKDAAGRILAANQAYAETCGQSSPAALIGKTDADFFPADQAQRYQREERRVLKDGQPRLVEERREIRGEWVWFETHRAPVVDAAGKPLGTTGVSRDIAESKRLEAGVALRNAALAGLIRGEPLPGILELVTLAIQQEIPAWRCSILLLDSDGQHLRHGAAPGFSPAFRAAVDGMPAGERSAPCGMAAFRGERVIVENVNENPNCVPFLGLAQQIGVSACWSEPIRGPGGEILGTFAAYHRQPARPNARDIEQLVQSSQFAALILAHDRNVENIRDSQTTFRGIFEGIRQAVLVLDGQYNCLDANRGAEELFGCSRQEIVGGSMTRFNAPGRNDYKHGRDCMHKALAGSPQHFEYWGLDSECEPFLAEIWVQACAYFGQEALVVAVQEVTERYYTGLRQAVEHDLAQALAAGQERGKILQAMLESALRLPDLDCGAIYWPESDGGFRLAARQNLPAAGEAFSRIDAASPLAAAMGAGREDALALFSALGPGQDGIRYLILFPVAPEKTVKACLVLGSRRHRKISRGARQALESLRFYFGQTLLRLAAEEYKRLAASVFENAHEGIMITDAHGVLIEVNTTFTDLTGYGREEALGRKAGLLKSGHHDDDFYRRMWEDIQATGYWRGEVWNRKKTGEIFVELLTISTVRDPAGEISHYVGIFTDITVQKEHQQRLEYLAHFDSLTQLPNRALLADRMHLAMAHARRTGKLLAICYLDLDNFKPVNDRFGHDFGDRLLVAVSARLAACLRGEDTVSRLGGDEFVLLFVALQDEQEYVHALNRVIESLRPAFAVLGQEVFISASIGVTLFPVDDSDPDTLLRHADQAMYHAKQQGRNRYHLFDPETDRRARIRLDNISRLRQALEDREFVLHYQPKVDMRQGKVVGVEALIRWQHPQQGLVPPLDFLPAIQGTELDIAIGHWVLTEALGQMTRWQAAGLDIAVSVNIAGTHLQSPDFAAMLARLLAAHPTIPPERLELEVLETTALEDMGRVAEIFDQCRQLGVTFSLDDFGTGYSSLTYLRRLPAESLKIDQSFVCDMLEDSNDLAIVEGVIGLTRAFRRGVIAEGVESVEHGMVLLQLGCDLAQGFGIAQPMPAADLAGWIAGYRPDQTWANGAAAGWMREDIPMLVAEVEHRRWEQALLDYLADPAGDRQPPAREPRDCPFGQWYYGPARYRYDTLAPFLELEEVHTRLHAVGANLIALREKSRTPIPAEELEQLDVLSRTLLHKLRQLQVEIHRLAAIPPAPSIQS